MLGVINNGCATATDFERTCLALLADILEHKTANAHRSWREQCYVLSEGSYIRSGRPQMTSEEVAACVGAGLVQMIRVNDRPCLRLLDDREADVSLMLSRYIHSLRRKGGA